MSATDEDVHEALAEFGANLAAGAADADPEGLREYLDAFGDLEDPTEDQRYAARVAEAALAELEGGQ